MKVRYESDDGLVRGYGDEGKAAVEAHEADPLSRFYFPWTWEDGEFRTANGKYIAGEKYIKVALLGSRLAPLVQDTIKQADISWHQEWRTRKPEVFYYAALIEMEQVLKETLNA